MASHTLKQLQTVRRIDREDAEPAFGGKFEIRSSKSETGGVYTGNFAEQSQKPAFGGKLEARNPKPVLSNVEGFETSGAYGENFAEQSQSPAFGGKSEARISKSETQGSEKTTPMSDR